METYETMTDRILRLEPGENVCFPAERRKTIKVLASRAGTNHKRIYISRTKPDGCYVWRVA